MLPASVHEEIVLITDPRVLLIPILENNEPLVDLKDQSEIAYGPSPEIPNNQDYTQLRKTVYEKLKEAQTFLPEGLKFCLYEGLRSLALQELLFENRFSKLTHLYPTWTGEQIFKETTKMVSPVINPDGSKNIPPHATGAAVDVYLITRNGEAVDMGIHPRDWMNDTEGMLSFTESNKISQLAHEHRGIMRDALKAVGFVNYPTEYWHWSYGDRYWAYHAAHPHAIYGVCK